MLKINRGCCLAFAAIFLAGLLAGPAFAQTKGIIWQEDFEGYAGEAVFPAPAGGEVKNGLVKAGVGFKGGRALAVDSLKVNVPLAAGLAEPVWVQCRVKAAAGSRQLNLNVSTNLFVVCWAKPVEAQKEQPAYTQLVVPYYDGYRIYTPLKLDDAEWTTLTFKLDPVRHAQTTWVNDTVMVGECDLPDQPLLSVSLAFGGVPDKPVLVDDLSVRTVKPADLRDRPLYPAGKPGRLFRFAAMGDPQPGLENYNVELHQFRRAVKQVNESGAEFTLILGDLVHDGKVDTTYQDLAATAKSFSKPWYPVRGNHDAPEKFKQYFKSELNYSFEHKDFRFVMLDAVGGQEELTAEQLAWVEKEFQAAKTKKQEIVVCTHVSVWDDNLRGVSPYMQIGPESKAKLKELYKKYNALLMLSGHYHRGPWLHQEEKMSYLVLPGPAWPRNSPSSWQIFDVYPDRVEMYTKQVFLPYDDETATGFINIPYQSWVNYETLRTGKDVPAKLHFPYLVQGPLVIKRNVR
ncbi:MAG TPA: metallophosphoesterase [bacterium]|nr:metallophosphoesterase [bacterium]HNS48690.1 metallophosphoesterase [bacterium]